MSHDEGVNLYDKGQGVELEAHFKKDGVLSDPSSMVCKVRRPDGTEEVLSTTHPSVGVFRAEVVADQSGDWYYQFVGSGSVAAGDEHRFRVRPSKF